MSVLYLTCLKKLFSTILDYFFNFITFILVLSKIFLNLSAFLVISLRKMSLLNSYLPIKLFLKAYKRKLFNCPCWLVTNGVLKRLWGRIC